MSSDAATWVRFTRLIPIETAAKLTAKTAYGHVAALHARGWTADDIAHAVIVGTATARNPAALIQHNLKTLVDGRVPPPTDPDITPTPPPLDKSMFGPGTTRASDHANAIRARLREPHGTGTGTETKEQ